MGEEERRVRAVEDDDVEVAVPFDEPDELGELRHGRGGDRVDGRVVEGHPEVTGAATVDPEVLPGPGPGRVGRDGHADDAVTCLTSAM